MSMPNMTIREAVWKDHPARIEYEVYRTGSTASGVVYEWIIPENTQFNFEPKWILQAIIDGKKPDLKIWNTRIKCKGVMVYDWTKWEILLDSGKYVTDPIKRAVPKPSNHNNNCFNNFESLFNLQPKDKS